MEGYKRVILSNRTKTNRLGSDGKQCMCNKGLIEGEVQVIVQFGGENTMIWSCMGWDSVGNLVEVKGRIDANQYMDILEQHLSPSMRRVGISKGDVIFQQDNDPKHNSEKAQNWMGAKNITFLDYFP